MKTLIETTTTEEKVHEDGFEYRVIKYSTSEGRTDTWAEVPSKTAGPSRMPVSKYASYWARVKNKYYYFDGEKLVVSKQDPTVEEMVARIMSIGEKMIAQGVYLLEFDCSCEDCGEDLSKTYLFSPGKVLYEAGCSNAAEYIREFFDVHDTGLIAKQEPMEVLNAYKSNVVQTIINYYLENVDGIERWIDEPVS